MQNASPSLQKQTKNEILDWWTRFPNARIGIITGEISNLSAFNFDSWTSLRHFDKIIFEANRTFIIDCLSKIQVLFQHYPGLRNKSGLFNHINIKSNGQYIIAPLSLNRWGRIYEWTIGDPYKLGLDYLLEVPLEILKTISILKYLKDKKL